MTEPRDRLAADLHERCSDFHPASLHLGLADRLIALGWTRLDEERLYRVIADTAWDAATSPVGNPEDGIEMHDLGVLARAIAKAYREDTDAT